jgi:four helix bundle protein
MAAFDFQRLDVYRATVEFLAVAHALIERLPRGSSHLVDQLQRAGTSIALNIAEGAGEAQASEKARFYRMARRSAFECAAVLDVLAANRLADETELRNGYALLERIGGMLTRLAATAADRVRESLSTASGSDSDAGRPESDSDSENDTPALD